MHSDTQAILFDLDGTLLNSTDLILRCFRHSWESVCGFSHSRESVLQTFGTPLRDAMRWLLRAARTTRSVGISAEAEDDTIDRLVAEYRCYNTSSHDLLVRPFDGTREVLAELRARGYIISVVTSKSRELGLRGLRLCSIDDLIDSGVFLEDTNVHKPNPEPILAALQRLNQSAQAAAYVGDSRHDIVAARSAGVRSVAALWGPALRTELERERPDFLAESITDLLEIFG